MYTTSTGEKWATPSAAIAPLTATGVASTTPSSTRAGLLSRPEVPFLRKEAQQPAMTQTPAGMQQPAVIQRSSPGTGFPTTGLEMIIEPESIPSGKVKWHDYSQTRGASPNLDLTVKMYWSIWERYNTVIDSVINNPLAVNIFNGTSLINELTAILDLNKKTNDFSLTHGLMVTWYNSATKILPPGQTIRQNKDLKIQLDEMLVLTNLMNDMGAANEKQSQLKKAKGTAMMVFFIGDASDEAEAMITIDRTDPSLPYIANFWGPPRSGSGNELLKAIPSLLNVTKFRLHALNQDIADIYTKNYNGKPK